MPIATPDITGINSVLFHRLADGVLRLDISGRKVIRNGEEIALNIREFCMLAILMRNPIVIPSFELIEATDRLEREI